MATESDVRTNAEQMPQVAASSAWRAVRLLCGQTEKPDLRNGDSRDRDDGFLNELLKATRIPTISARA
jgi:hypothetical protein